MRGTGRTKDGLNVPFHFRGTSRNEVNTWLFFVYICTCMHAHMYTCMHASMSVCVCTCIWRSGQILGIFLDHCPLFFLRQSLSLSLGIWYLSLDSLNWLAHQLPMHWRSCVALTRNSFDGKLRSPCFHSRHFINQSSPQDPVSIPIRAWCKNPRERTNLSKHAVCVLLFLKQGLAI